MTHKHHTPDTGITQPSIRILVQMLQLLLSAILAATTSQSGEHNCAADAGVALASVRRPMLILGTRIGHVIASLQHMVVTQRTANAARCIGKYGTAFDSPRSVAVDDPFVCVQCVGMIIVVIATVACRYALTVDAYSHGAAVVGRCFDPLDTLATSCSCTLPSLSVQNARGE